MTSKRVSLAIPKAVDIDVSGVTTAAHDNTADAGMVVPRVNGVPTTIEKDFGPAAKIHGIGINRNADVAEIASAIPRGNIHAPAKRDGKSEVRDTCDLGVQDDADRH
jgi:hypothetical protein